MRFTQLFKFLFLVLPCVLIIFCANPLFAQFSIDNTIEDKGYTILTNNGSGSYITFIITNNNTYDILLTEVGRYIATYSSGVYFTLYYSATSLSGPLNINSSDWIQIHPGNQITYTTSKVYAANSLTNFVIPAGSTYRFASKSNGTNTYAYVSPNGPYSNMFTLNGVTFATGNYQINGAAVGYAGSNSPRFFSGSIKWTPLASGTNKVAIFSADSTSKFCNDSNDVIVSIGNIGNNSINNLTVNWSMNGNPQPPVNYTNVLPTIPFSSNWYTQINLGTINFLPGKNVLKAWVTLAGTANLAIGYDTLYTNLYRGLEGDYTIGGPNADFANFNEAQKGLEKYGICGNVNFKVADGIYSERLIFYDNLDVTASKQITFESISGNPTNCEIQYTPPSQQNFVLKFSKSKFIHFKGIGIYRADTVQTTAVFITDSSSFLSFDNCYFHHTPVAVIPQLNNQLIVITSQSNNITIKNSVLEGGHNSLRVSGYSQEVISDIALLNNEIKNFYNEGLKINWAKNLTIDGNVLKSSELTPTSGFTALSINDISGNSIINGNRVYPNAYGMPNIPFNLSGATGSSSNPIVVSNNIFVSGLAPTISSSSSKLYSLNYVTVAHNNFINYNNGVNSAALSVNANVNYDLKNNNIINLANNGSALQFGSSLNQITASNYNNIYTASNLLINSFPSFATLIDWQATGFDVNSVSTLPTFSQNLYTHCDPILKNAGTPTAVQYDIEGDTRSNTTPDIGADEIGPTTNIVIDETAALCAGAPTLLVANPFFGDTIVWQNSDTALSYLATQPGTITVASYNACGVAFDTIFIQDVNPVTLPNDTAICIGTNTTIGTTITGTYAWSTNATTPTISVSSAGTYTLTVVDTFGCTSSDSIFIDQLQLPDPTFAVSQNYATAYCAVNQPLSNSIYSWDFGDGTLLTDTVVTHTYAVPGVYTIKLVAENECGLLDSEATFDTEVENVTEISLEQSFSIYPNPTSHSFSIVSTTQHGAATLEILDMNGKKLASYFLRNIQSATAISMEEYSAGIYTLHIINGNSNHYQKLVLR